MEKIYKYVFLLLFAVCFAINGCTKTNEKDTRGVLLPSDNIENIAETVEIEPDEPEVDEYTYDAETTTPTTKITRVTGQKANFSNQSSGCTEGLLQKYSSYFVGGNAYEYELTLSKANTITSIVNPTGYYTMSVIEVQSPTLITVTMTNTPTPDYKARNVQWVVTFQNGEKTNFYMKMIPVFSGNLYASSQYQALWERWKQQPDKYNLNQQLGGLSKTTITGNWQPAILDIIFYAQTHYGVIVNSPIQKTARINGVNRLVWTFKIRERNAKCNLSSTTKTVKWWEGQKLPSASTSRDSSYQYYRAL